MQVGYAEDLERPKEEIMSGFRALCMYTAAYVAQGRSRESIGIANTFYLQPRMLGSRHPGQMGTMYGVGIITDPSLQTLLTHAPSYPPKCVPLSAIINISVSAGSC